MSFKQTAYKYIVFWSRNILTMVELICRNSHFIFKITSITTYRVKSHRKIFFFHKTMNFLVLIFPC